MAKSAKPKKPKAVKKSGAFAKPPKPSAAAPAKSEFTIIKKNIPTLPRFREGGALRYPFANMQTGEQFFVATQINAAKYKDPGEAHTAQLEANRLTANRLSGAVRRFKKTHPGVSFTVRTTLKGVEQGFHDTTNAGVVVKREKESK